MVRIGPLIDAVTTRDYLQAMKAIGVKLLKARLSEYLRAVRGGETLLVTDRNVVIAEIRPVSRRAPPRDTMDDALNALAEDGEISRARIAKRGWHWNPRNLGLPAGSATRVLDEMRAERERS